MLSELHRGLILGLRCRRKLLHVVLPLEHVGLLAHGVLGTRLLEGLDAPTYNLSSFQDEVLDQHEEEEQGLHHERRILGFLVFRLRIPALLLQLETFLDGDDADVDQAVGEDVDDRHLP